MSRQRIVIAEPNHVDAPGSGRRQHRRRSGRRIPVEAPVMLNADIGGVEAIACDISENGLRIAVQSPPPPGPITVKMVGLPIFPGEVRWRDSSHVGILLGQPISTEILATWVQVHSRGPDTVAGRPVGPASD